MYSGDQVVVVVDAVGVHAAHMTPSAAGALQPDHGVVRRSLSVTTDELGDPVPVGAEGAAGHPVDGLLSRVGDPVPVRVGSRSWPAEVLVATVIADAVAAVAGESADVLVLVVPDEWRAHRRDVLGRSVAELTEQPVTTVAAALGLMDAGPGDEPAASALVLTAGDESFRADLFTHGDEGWQAPRTSRSDWGGSDIDDALVDFVDERSRSAHAKGAHDAAAVRAACASARQDLARRTATEVALPGREPVRLVRADLELLVGGTVTDVVDQLVADVVDPHGARPSRVLVTGPLGSLPMVVEAVSTAVGTSVEHVTDDQALRRYADAGAAAMESPEDAGPDTPGYDTEDTQELPIASLRAARGQERHRRTAILVAASLAIAAPVAAVTMTDAGEDALLSMVDGIVPQDSSVDAAPGDLLGRLADAATLPAMPWSSADDGSDATTDGSAGGTSASEDGARAPSPTSTHGSGKDDDGKAKDEKGKDKDAKGDDKKKDEKGKGSSTEKKDEKGKSSTTEKKGDNADSTKGKDKESGTASPDSPSSGQDTTSDVSTPSPEDDQTPTPDDNSSTETDPATTEPTTEPPTTDDPPTTEPSASASTETSTTEPSASASTTATSGDGTAVAATATTESGTP